MQDKYLHLEESEKILKGDRDLKNEEEEGFSISTTFFNNPTFSCSANNYS